MQSLFVIMVKYVKPLEEVDVFLKEHRAFLDAHYAKGDLICSGRQMPRVGGVILARGNDRSQVWDIVRQDPFYVNGVAEYDVTEFVPNKAATGFSFLD
mgnify:CR=1 FL=1